MIAGWYLTRFDDEAHRSDEDGEASAKEGAA